MSYLSCCACHSFSDLLVIGNKTFENSINGEFVPWNARIVLVLQENEMWDEVVNITQSNPIQVLTSIDPTALVSFNKRISRQR